jgi:uncharacterized membrane protein YraQ (UPF0718 family)
MSFPEYLFQPKYRAERVTKSARKRFATPAISSSWITPTGSYAVVPVKSRFYEQVTGVKCFLFFPS